MTNQYGYIRVSTREQNEDRQLLAMRELPILAHHPMIAMGREMSLERAIALGAGWLPRHRVESILEQLRRL